MRHISVIPSGLGHKDKDGKITQKGKREGCESFRLLLRNFQILFMLTKRRGRDLPSWMKKIFINVSSKCFLHERVHSTIMGAKGEDGKMRGKVKGEVIYVLDSNNIISDFIQGKRG
jgi:hypothetical protein